MSSVIVRPIARPAIDLKVPRGSAARGEDDPDEEEGEDRLDDQGRFVLEAGPDRRRAQISLEVAREDPLQERCGDDGAPELGDPVRTADDRGEPAGDQEAEASPPG